MGRQKQKQLRCRLLAFAKAARPIVGGTRAHTAPTSGWARLTKALVHTIVVVSVAEDVTVALENEGRVNNKYVAAL